MTQELNQIAALAYTRAIADQWIDNNKSIKGGRLKSAMILLVKEIDKKLINYQFSKQNEAILFEKMTRFSNKAQLEGKGLDIAEMAALSMALLERYFSKGLDGVFKQLRIILDYFERVNKLDSSLLAKGAEYVDLYWED